VRARPDLDALTQFWVRVRDASTDRMTGETLRAPRGDPADPLSRAMLEAIAGLDEGPVQLCGVAAHTRELLDARGEPQPSDEALSKAALFAVCEGRLDMSWVPSP
jgi:hypothetical protein